MGLSSPSLVALALVAAVATGCSSSPSSPTTLTTDRIAGTWTLMSIQPAGQAEQAAPAGASYTLTLADGRAFTQADCNTCGGTLAVGGQTLTIGPALACTRAACPTMAFENTYVTMLAGDCTARIDGMVLTLTSPRGVVRFRR